MSIYKGMFEASTVSVSSDGESIKPYYDKNVLNGYINDYFEQNLKRYTKDYTLNVEYLSSSGDYCTDLCRKVKITLNANINYFYKYEKSQIFSIVGKDEV